MASLILKKNKNQIERYNLLDPLTTIGKDPSCHIRISGECSELFQIQITKRGSLFVIESMTSCDIFVNNEKIKNAVLRNGDTILIGENSFEFVESVSLQVVQKLWAIPAEGGREIHLIEDYPTHLKPLRKRLQQKKSLGKNLIFLKKIEQFYQDTQNFSSPKELSSFLTKFFLQLDNQIKQVSIFLATKKFPEVELIACAHNKNSHNSKINVYKRALADVLSRRSGLILQEEKKSSEAVFFLPGYQEKKVFFIIQLELSGKNIARIEKKFEQYYYVTQRFSPFLQTLILRSDIDTYFLSMMETIVKVIEAKDTYTVGHSERVCRYSLAIADELGLNKETKKFLTMSALCHDIGKIGISDQILKKAALLNHDEYAEMKLHPSLGAEIVSCVPGFELFISGVKHHHERYDGSGYPDGLVGEEIPFFARIIAVADVFDAIISGRSYSGFVEESDAIFKIKEEKELFDPHVIDALVRAWEKGRVSLRTSTKLGD